MQVENSEASQLRETGVSSCGGAFESSKGLIRAVPFSRPKKKNFVLQNSLVSSNEQEI